MDICLDCFTRIHNRCCGVLPNDEELKSGFEVGFLNYLRIKFGQCSGIYSICYIIAAKGHLNCLKYAHNKGCNIICVCSSAAEEGYIECLKYGYENGDIIDISTYLGAIQFNNIDCLNYIIENCGLHNDSNKLKKVIYDACDNVKCFLMYKNILSRKKLYKKHLNNMLKLENHFVFNCYLHRDIYNQIIEFIFGFNTDN